MSKLRTFQCVSDVLGGLWEQDSGFQVFLKIIFDDLLRVHMGIPLDSS